MSHTAVVYRVKFHLSRTAKVETGLSSVRFLVRNGIWFQASWWIHDLIFLRRDVYEIIHSWQVCCVITTVTLAPPGLCLIQPASPCCTDPSAPWLDFTTKCQLSYIFFSSCTGYGQRPRTVLIVLFFRLCVASTVSHLTFVSEAKDWLQTHFHNVRVGSVILAILYFSDVMFSCMRDKFIIWLIL